MTHERQHEATPTPEQEPGQIQPLQGRLVLVVDDDNGIRSLLRLALVTEGYSVLTAINGAQALQLLRDPDDVGLILLDMRMPEMDGWAFARALQGTNLRPLPIIVISAAADVARWAAEIQASGYLAKPFALQDVRAAVGNYLDRPERSS